MGIEGQGSVSISINGNSSRLAGCAIQTVNLIESVYSLAPTLYLKVLDPYGAMRQYPLIGQETLSITISSANQQETTFDLAVWKCWTDDINNPTEPTMWNIVATHPAYLRLKRLNYSRVFKNATAASAVRKIAGEAGITDFDVEDTDLPLDWVQPRFSGIGMIEYLRHRAFASSRRQGGFVSFLNRHGRLTFRSTESLIERRPVATLTTGKGSGSNAQSTETAGLYAFQVENRAVSLAADGAAGATGGYYDALNDQFVVLKERPDRSFHKITTSRSLLPTSTVSPDSFYMGDFGRIDRKGAGSVFGRAPLHTQMILRLDSLIRLPGVTFGRFDTSLWLPGQVVTVNIASSRSDEVSDAHLAGNWVIAELDQEFGVRPVPVAKMILVRSGTDSDLYGGLLANPGGVA